MEFDEKVAQISRKVSEQKDGILTEEATKNAFIMPFISSVLGYDIFDPTEVIPEFTADVGTRKNEKVDYALVLDDQVQILIECKKVGTTLSLENASQLYRYFACTKARIGILTNGQTWNFYMDIEEPNKMDSKPFLILDLLDIDKTVLPELQKLSKSSFDIDSVSHSAEELKYVSSIKRAIAEEFKSPSDEMVKLLASKVYTGAFRASVLDKFRPLVEKSMRRYLSDQVNDRLTSALDAEETEYDEAEQETCSESNDIVTTEEELAGYRIVQAIACSDVEANRVTMRDAKSYCAVFLDDNNRRPVMRMYFNTVQKYIGLFRDGEALERTSIDSVDDIYKYADVIRDEVRYLIER